MMPGSVDVTFTEQTFPAEKRPKFSSFLQAEDRTLYKFLSGRRFSKVGLNL